jgi:hypothetical protein
VSSYETIQTRSGRYVAPLRLDPEDVDVADIAHALSNQCRFGGHTRVFYSVAEHSCRVSDLVAEQGGSDYETLYGLLHDAAEAYLVDLPRPIKHAIGLERYRAAESTVMEAISVALGLDAEVPAIVHEADNRLLVTERRDLMHARDDEVWRIFEEVEPLPERIRPWKPEVAKYGYVRRYVTLCTRLGRL